MPRTTWGPLSTDEQNQIEFAPVGEPGVLAPGTTGGLLKRNADGTIGNSILSESGSVLTAAGRLVIGGGTVTASTPVIDATQTWNNGAVVFTGLKFNAVNTASATASLFMDFQRDGVSRFSVTRNGVLSTDAAIVIPATGASITMGSDVILQRNSAGVLDLRNGANAQTWNVYGTADAGLTNYRRLRATMTTGGAATIAAEGLGTGVSGNTLAFAVNGSTAFSIGSSGGLNIGNGINFTFSTSTGTKIGTATNEKLGFWNATPIVQPSSTGETVGFTAGGGTTVTDSSTFTGNVGSTAYRLSDIVKHLKNAGLIAQ